MGNSSSGFPFFSFFLEVGAPKSYITLSKVYVKKISACLHQQATQMMLMGLCMATTGEVSRETL